MKTISNNLQLEIEKEAKSLSDKDLITSTEVEYEFIAGAEWMFNKIYNTKQIIHKNHRWENLNTHPMGYKCKKCGIEKYKMRYGWQYEYIEKVARIETYFIPDCKPTN